MFCNQLCYDILYKYDYQKVSNRDFCKIDKVVGFINLQSCHWALVYAVKKTRTFYYLDSLVATESEVNLAFKIWKKFMSKRPTGDFP